MVSQAPRKAKGSGRKRECPLFKSTAAARTGAGGASEAVGSGAHQAREIRGGQQAGKGAGRAVGEGQVEHLVEVAVVEGAVPSDREERAAHDAARGPRVERAHEQVHVPTGVAAALEELEETADRHVGDRVEVIEDDAVPR